MTDNEITELIQELDRLQIQITRVNERLRQIDNTTQVTSKPEKSNTENAIRVGDTVEVTNKYMGRLGVQGTVLKITSAQVLIRELNSDETFRKYKANVRRIR